MTKSTLFSIKSSNRPELGALPPDPLWFQRLGLRPQISHWSRLVTNSSLRT